MYYRRWNTQIQLPTITPPRGTLKGRLSPKYTPGLPWQDKIKILSWIYTSVSPLTTNLNTATTTPYYHPSPGHIIHPGHYLISIKTFLLFQYSLFHLQLSSVTTPSSLITSLQPYYSLLFTYTHTHTRTHADTHTHTQHTHTYTVTQLKGDSFNIGVPWSLGPPNVYIKLPFGFSHRRVLLFLFHWNYYVYHSIFSHKEW